MNRLDIPVEVRSQPDRKIFVSFSEVFPHRKHKNDSIMTTRDIVDKTILQSESKVTRKEVFKTSLFDFRYFLYHSQYCVTYGFTQRI